VTGSGTLTFRSTAATTFQVPGTLSVGDATTGHTALNVLSATTKVTAAAVNIATGNGAVSGVDDFASVHVTDGTLSAGGEMLLAVYGGTGTLVVDGSAHVNAADIQVGYQWVMILWSTSESVT